MVSTSSNNNEIVQTRKGRVEVLASPGSGKTHTLIQRLSYLLAVGVPPDEILVLSFSNAAVNELKRRIRQYAEKPTLPVIDSSSSVTVQTAHAFARQFIGKSTLLSEKSACQLLSQAIRSAQKACRKGDLWSNEDQEIIDQRLDQVNDLSRHPVKDLLLFFAIVRASRMSVPTATSGQFAHFKGYTDVLEAIRIGFAKAKKRKSVIDFADMLSLAVKEIKGGAKVHYQHILVDEYQDCSPAQTHLLAHLVRSGDRNIMVFGDKYQAIFGFGGATYTPLSRVLDGVSTLRLPKSRRLTVETAALASAVAQHTSKQAIRANRNGVKPVLVIDKTADKQIRHIVRDIQALIAKGVPLNKIVVLARTKALLLPVEQALLDLGVCTNRIGLTRDRKHALRVLRLVEIVEKFEGNNEMSISLDMLKDQLPGLTNVSNERWKNEVSKLKKAVRSTSLEGRYQLCGKTYLRLCGGVRKDPDVRADVNRWEPLCRGQQDTKTMKAKIRSMRIDAVITSTIHSAKGGEWDYVFVVGVTDGLLPWYKSLNDTKSLSEERNLLYVAVTRARVAVRLYHAPTNHSKSRQRFSDVCRFLDKDGVMKTLSLVGRNR